MAINVDQAFLERACKEIIETILFCLPNAFKGTVYLIGRPPELLATRITSGIINEARTAISWGLPEKSDYNPPGKPWVMYRDQPDRPLEAMAWCVEKQKSWTAEDPRSDARSVRLQVEGIWEDFHHMEPVLLRKEDLYLTSSEFPLYPGNYQGDAIWAESDFATVAVIKIHFRPYTIQIGSPETSLIKKLSRALGTELLSYQVRQQAFEAMHQLAKEKVRACNVLAHSLRNAIAKSGVIFSLMKAEVGFIREQWESLVLKDRKLRDMKRQALERLSRMVERLNGSGKVLGKEILNAQERFSELSLPPEQGERWVKMQIEERWNELIKEGVLSPLDAEEVGGAIAQLKRSLSLGKDPDVLAQYRQLPQDLKQKWVSLIYHSAEQLDQGFYGELMAMLSNPSLRLPYKERSRKTLNNLKALADTVGELESDTNLVLREVLNGNGNHAPKGSMDITDQLQMKFIF
ncbi:MAG: hypothetical protein C4582_01630 [Desulfobacteraceae bacterium]|nr:MAG: hypothetical protein C4582_01630 [Desulfobacteraceae bacterium]